MTDRPILFSGPMVRALLDGRKTQTRRVVRDVPDRPAMDNIAWPDGKLHAEPYLDAYCGAQKTAENPRGMTANWAYWTRDDRPGRLFKVGFVPGDRLWVREAHALVGTVDPGWLLYRASGYESECIRHGFTRPYPPETAVRWRPSIHMPRWASRLTLIVTDVRVQRLQEISADDCRAEGHPVEPWRSTNPEVHDDAARDWFRDLWDSLNAERGYGWGVNPWVCAVTFTVHKQNIDQMEQRT